MLGAYEEVLADDYFERLERFLFWEKSIPGPHRRLHAPRLRAGASGPARPGQAASPLRPGLAAGPVGGGPARVLPCRLVLDDAERQRRRRDVLHPPGPSERGPRQHPLLESRGDLERSALRAVPSGACEIMARRGAVSDFSKLLRGGGSLRREGCVPHALLLLGGDADFRRQFHEMVEAMPKPSGRTLHDHTWPAVETTPRPHWRLQDKPRSRFSDLTGSFARGARSLREWSGGGARRGSERGAEGSAGRSSAVRAARRCARRAQIPQRSARDG